MDRLNDLTCPNCSSKDLTLKYEATYVYSYVIDDNAPGTNNVDVFQSYLFDKREQKDSKQYVECNICGEKQQCYNSEIVLK